jgi:hypothetical protein
MFGLSVVAMYLTVSIYKCNELGHLRERYHPEDPGVDGRIILRWIFRKPALLNAVLNLRVQ